MSELLELGIDALITELLTEETREEKILDDKLDSTEDDCNELLVDDIAGLLEESDDVPPPPQPVSNTTITATILIFSKLRLDRPTTLIVTKTLPSNTWLLS